MKRAKKTKAAGQSAPAALPWRSLLPAAGLAVLVLFVYWPTLDHGFFFDDEGTIQFNPTLKSLDGLYRIWFELGAAPQYYPLMHTTHWAEYQLWRLDPRGYHIVNFLLHAATAVLVWRLMLRLAVPGAWLAAAVFAVHPVCVESVAYVSERKNVLSCLLAIGSMLAYLQFSPPESTGEAGSRAPGDRGSWRYYCLSLVLYVAALLSKTAIVSEPAVLLVIFWWKRGRLTWRDATRLVPFFVVGVALACVTILVESMYVGARGAEWNLSPVDRVLLAGRALWFYVGKLAWPHPIIFIYPRFVIDSHAWWQYLFPAAALLAIVALWIARSSIGRAPLAAVLIYAGVLAPVLGFFNIYMFRITFVADHLQYQASIALIALAAAAIARGSQYAGRAARPWVIPSTVAGVLVPLVIMARVKTEVYESPQSVYEDVIAHNPGSWVAHVNLAWEFQRRGKFAEGIARLRRAVATFDQLEQIDPKDSAALHGRADVYLRLGERAKAIADYEKALRLDSQNGEMLNNLAWLLATSPEDRLRDGKRAVELAKHACQHSSKDDPHSLSTLAASYAEAGEFDAAVAAAKQVVQIYGNQANANFFEELKSYEAGRPWRDATPPMGTSDRQVPPTVRPK